MVSDAAPSRMSSGAHGNRIVHGATSLFLGMSRFRPVSRYGIPGVEIHENTIPPHADHRVQRSKNQRSSLHANRQSRYGAMDGRVAVGAHERRPRTARAMTSDERVDAL